MTSDQGRQFAWTTLLLEASLACTGCAGGNDEVRVADDAAAQGGGDGASDSSPAGSAPDASSGSDARGDTGSSASGTDGGDGGTSASADGGHGASGSQCTNPSCIVSNNGCTEGSYYLFDNQWNCGPSSGFTCGPETLYGCSYDSWYVVSKQPAGNTAVLTFPSVQRNFDDNPLVSSFTTIASTFSEASPHVGDYEVAYDIWLNDQANEVMIWVDNYNQAPGGKKVASNVSLGGRTYDIWWASASGYIAFVADTTFTAGTVDILQIFNYAIQQKWLPATSTLGQINLGVEICSTEGQDATWSFDDVSVTAN